ncbi:MAG: chromate transporter [Prevotella sp.]|nr:chromate transporter [Prevotella sp.]MDD7046392.1 chromate transporter [Prevotella sp.]MDY5547076.1 chromate transporter [Prevotella sp.]
MLLFLKIFYVFTKIGTFNFGGGYAMLSLIHNEVVIKNQWMTNAEFTDMVAISQSTPGPIGINAATYAGYTAVLHQGYPEWAAVLSSVLASLSIIWLPFILMLLISHYLITHKDSKIVKDVFAALRPAIIGLIGAAALLLMNRDNFNSPQESPWLWSLSVVMFALAFYFTRYRKTNPILILLVSGIVGLVVY